MKQIPVWQVLMAYLKGRWGTALLCVLFPAVSLLVSILYGQPLEPSLYASALVETAALFFFLAGFYHYYKKHTELSGLLCHCDAQLGPLPPSHDLLEHDYQAILFALDRSRALEIDRSAKTEAEALHYYTLWAHQIKTPISAMRLLLQEQENPPLSQELFKIEQYVEMVLQYVRLGSQSSDLILEERRLSDLVRQAVQKTSTLFIHKRIELKLPDLSRLDLRGTVLTDEKWMVFVLEQLLTNAVKYTLQGSVSLYLSEQEDLVTLVIEDTGIGIRKEDLPRVFEWGFTGYNGRQDKRSTGIGLYLCRQITRKLGHDLRLESVVGEGTKVFLSFSTKRMISY